jgi:hypothetical protein
LWHFTLVCCLYWEWAYDVYLTIKWENVGKFYRLGQRLMMIKEGNPMVVKEGNLISYLACKSRMQGWLHLDRQRSQCDFGRGHIPCNTIFIEGVGLTRDPTIPMWDTRPWQNPNPNRSFWVLLWVEMPLSWCLHDNDDDHKHCHVWAMLLEAGGDKKHAKIFIHACIKQAWDFAASNRLY